MGGSVTDLILPIAGAAIGIGLAPFTGGASVAFGLTAAELVAGGAGVLGGALLSQSMNQSVPDYSQQYGQSWQMPNVSTGPSAEELAYYQAQTDALNQQQADAAEAEAEATAAEAETRARNERRTRAAAAGRRTTNPTGASGLLGEAEVRRGGLLGG